MKNNSNIIVGFQINKAYKEKLNRYCKNSGMKKSVVIEKALIEYINKKELEQLPFSDMKE